LATLNLLASPQTAITFTVLAFMSAFLAAPCAHAVARSPAERATCAPRSALRARRVVSVRAAADEGFSPAALKSKYDELSQSVPPLLTAAAIPVIALSLLCKAATGSGLPGALGLVEGLSYLALPFGLPNFLPRVGEIASGGDFSSDAVLAILSRDVRGESASERVARITVRLCCASRELCVRLPASHRL